MSAPEIDEGRLLLAAVAMHALLQLPDPGPMEGFHKHCVEHADALLKELEKTTP